MKFDVPADWSLAVVDGDRVNGYVRLDDEDIVRLELKWEKPKGRVVLSQIVDRYLQELERRAKKAKLDLTCRRSLNFKKHEGKECEYFSCDSDFQAFGLMLYCPDCRRVCLLRVLQRPGGGVRALAKRIFASFREHPDDGRLDWSFYEFRFSIPDSFYLETSSLKTGCLEMCFDDRKDEMEAVRVSLAEVLLKKNRLEDWFTEFYAKRLKRMEVELSREKFKGHEAVRCRATSSIRRNLLKIFQSKRYLNSLAWHCRDSDKLFIFRVTSSKQDDQRLEEYAQLVQCHGDGTSDLQEEASGSDS